MSKRGTRRRFADWWKRRTTRMKSTPLLSADSFDERLRNVFSLHAATPVLNEYLSSIEIDDDDPGFVLSWDLDNLNAFVAAANALNPARAAGWVRTRPPHMTANSFTDDIVHELHQVAGGRCGRVLLAPNSFEQFGAITLMIGALQHDDFLQDAAQVALPVVNNVERYIATTYNLTDTKAQRSVENNLPPTRRNGQPLRRIFI
ncbi:uncharacterized protein PITG_08120 [Phytophthora infestans T30-4]|uniref:Uncharacterized protein n=2 Tax=Phytophthora infestans TaxID=4787 RepID=D0N9I3_PHYIT|nr:uncharacterized protein PITG_08120 [Phytophthora infestans T30-4]EEY54471.1 conserved hypothetical protein [Phytophthora infestans T30-4]KAF4136358.1 hypothetical protein GN958_ATG14530 [Phytophthora infestans]KAF4136363.1 hypothetical protein GN958_ATG14535 [Phytophthora infestans]KAF4146111.1 hypothetical protein GN958_ATG04777 [Phytophthora infestans]|eukprot:XP_002904293.1 conserved hypothetical protein [Phytophthora infestans T30-4]